jgi:nucleotide-binding universal stress UspA family protein
MKKKSKNSKKRLLVPVDFSTAAAPLIAFARQLARDLDAAITVLHVIEPFHVDWRMDTTAFQRQQRLEATKSLRQLMKREFKDVNEARAALRSGYPVEEITEFARRSRTDMIVIATHGRTGMKRVLLGSVAERVVRHAHCPVVVVR